MLVVVVFVLGCRAVVVERRQNGCSFFFVGRAPTVYFLGGTKLHAEELSVVNHHVVATVLVVLEQHYTGVGASR